MDPKHISVNWRKLQTQLKEQNISKEKHPQAQKRNLDRVSHSGSTRILEEGPHKKPRYSHARVTSGRMQASKPTVNGAASTTEVLDHAKDSVNAGLSEDIEIGKYVAVDCEMVGVGPQPGLESALARVSITNYDGEQIYDSYVKPKEMVTDWRTHVSGIMPRHMAVARNFEEVQRIVSQIFQDRILIGHSVSYDLDALLLSHPRRDIRDTARHPAYRKLAGGCSPKLKILASELLGVNIQTGEHSSIEDARACMMLFRRDKAAFEREHARKYPAPKTPPPPPPSAENGERATKKQKKKKKKKKK